MIKDLEKKIDAAQKAYHNGASIMDDNEYDALIYQLENLDPTNKLLVNIGADPNNEWEKVKHKFPLGSLNKVNSEEDMSKWINETLGGRTVLVAEKLDGLSIGCLYEDGNLVAAPLRGGGEYGENIISNVIKMIGVKKSIPEFDGVLRGEIILTKSNHQKHFPDYSNPRNAASGICRRFDGEGSEHLSIIFYQVLGQEFKTEEEQFKWLNNQGFLTPNYKVCNAAEVNEFWKDYQSKIRQSLDYEIDGLVVSCNEIEFQESLGITSLRPKGKLAFKFANQFVKTTIKDITWATGNSGRITPICWVEPVSLLGSIVSKASGYNVGYLERTGIDIGAEVLICKAGEIIPRVEKVIVSTGTIVSPPTVCPSCNGALEMQGENLQCISTATCPAQLSGRLKNWVSSLNLLELGDTILERLSDSGIVKDVADLYTISVDDIASMERMAKKSATNVYNSIWSSTNISLDQLIGSLSIPMVATSTMKLITSAGYDTIEKLHAVEISDLEKINGMGLVRAKSFVEGMKQNKGLIDKLLNNKITIKEKTIGKLTNMKITFTGAMENKRTVLEQMVLDNGGEVKASVGKGSTHLVIADPLSQSSKAVKARSLGVKLISEAEFLSMIN